MDMKEVSKVMDEYFKTVTPEQFEQDLKDAGIEECPDKNDCPINNFSQLQWDVGVCVDCSVENKELFNACWDEGHKNLKPKQSKKIMPECYGDYPDCCYLSSECECKEDCKQKENKN